MKILALETSAKSVSAAVTENGAVLASAYQNRGLTHSVTLMPLIDGMLRTAGLSLDDIGLIAAANGPGSFTGLRIGVSAAKGLAWAKELPCCGVSTLAAMARTAWPPVSSSSPCGTAPIIKASIRSSAASWKAWTKSTAWKR